MGKSQRVLLLSNATSIHTARWLGELQARGYRVQLVDVSRRIPLPLWAPFLWLKALFALLFFRPDIVHAHYLTTYGIIAAFLPTRRLVVTLWGSDILVTAKNNNLAKKLSRFALKRAHSVFADGPILIQAADEIAKCESKCVLVHWGVSPVFHLNNVDVATYPVRFLSIRNHYAVYNIELIIDAFAKAFPDRRGVELIIAGGGELTASLKERTVKNGLNAVVRFTGMLNEQELAEQIRQSHVVISVPSSDGTAMSILESVACGRFVLCSDLVANRDFLGVNARYCRPENLEDLILSMKALQELGSNQLIELGRVANTALSSQVERKSQFDLVDRIYATVALST